MTERRVGNSRLVSDRSVGMDNDAGRGRRDIFVDALMQSTQTCDFASTLQRNGLFFHELPGIIINEDLVGVLTSLEDQPKKFRFQRGVVFSIVGLRQLPLGVGRDRLDIKAKTSARLFTEYSNWYLCDSSEEKLNTAISDTAVMVLGAEAGSSDFLLKFDGKLSALCLRDVETQDGKIFIEGNWYSPTDDNTRIELKSEFDSSKGRSVMRGSWALMRSLQAYNGKGPEEILNDTSIIARAIPDVYPNTEVFADGQSISRRAYRVKRLEIG